MELLGLEEFCNELIKCVDDNDLEKLQQLILAHRSERYHYEMKIQDLISWSIYKKCNEITYYLLSSKDILRHPNISSINAAEIPLAVVAAGAENYSLVKYLLTSKDLIDNAHINADDDSLFKIVARQGNVEMMEYLLFSPELKEHSNYQSKGYESIYIMAYGGHIPAIDYMLSKFEEKDEMLEAAVFGAVSSNHTNILEYAFNIDKKYQLSALLHAMSQDKTELQEFLIVNCNMPKTEALENIFERKIFQVKPEKTYYVKKLLSMRELEKTLKTQDKEKKAIKI